MVVGWTRQGDVATVQPLLIQPVVVTDVAEVLAEIARGEPQDAPVTLLAPNPRTSSTWPAAPSPHAATRSG